MKPTPLISVALCTYNGETFLEKQLDSLLLQTYQNLEIIVFDDNSSDGTIGILNRYASEHSMFRIFRNERNVGYTANFENALKHCNGEFIAICDQDDVWHPKKLETQLLLIGGHLLVYHDSQFIDKNGASMQLRISDKFNFYSGSDGTAFLFLNCVSGHTILMKRSLLEYTLPFPRGFHYDHWLAYIAATFGSIQCIDQPLVSYRQHSSNSTDILATKAKTQKKDIQTKLTQLTRESEWLGLCSEKAMSDPALPVHELYRRSIQRNHRLMSPSFGMLIWKHRHRTLFLLKKGMISKFFFTLRKIWGAPAKKLG